jgi:hypothetical protein
VPLDLIILGCRAGSAACRNRQRNLNQVTTFATGYHAKKATVIAFGPCEAGEEVHVGPVQVNGFNWRDGRYLRPHQRQHGPCSGRRTGLSARFLTPVAVSVAVHTPRGYWFGVTRGT